jgi:DNA-binding transcriptional regulator YdaS (Cro superfamily)
METHSEIIARLGGIREVARLLGHENHTTVQGWSERNKIPVEHWPSLIQASAGSVSTNDLVPPELRAA